eukprot:8112860-Karenia_brevis.AAC.1
MPTQQQVEDAKLVLFKHFDPTYFEQDVSHLSTSQIWASWSSHVSQALESGLKELANDVDCSLPATKEYQAH